MDLETTLATAETIDGWMTRRELEWLFRTARSMRPGALWVELGVWKGRSLFAVAMGLPRGATLLAVDSFTPGATALPFVPTREWVHDHLQAVVTGVRRLREDISVEVLRQDTAQAAARFDDAAADVVFFDADHTREGLARDVVAWAPRVREGGLFCGHDYSAGFPGVIQFVDEAFPGRTIVPETSIWHAVGAPSW